MSKAVIERRYTTEPVELRDSGDAKAITGYAVVFNRLSRDLGGFVERVDAKAFNKNRGDGWSGVICRYNHDDNMLLGTVGGNTLSLEVDNVGLRYTVFPPETRKDIYELVQRGDIRGSSFAFRLSSHELGRTDKGYPLRTITAAQLVDVAPVTSPAYLDTTATVRAFCEAMGVEADGMEACFEGSRAPEDNGPQRLSVLQARIRAIELDLHSRARVL